VIYNDDRPERIRGAIYLTTILLFILYQAINAFVPNADMIVAVRVLACSVYAAVIYVYGRDAWVAVSTPDPKRSDFLIVGIVLSFMSHFGQSAYAIAYRLADAPAWLLNAEVIAPVVILSMVAGVLHVTAPESIEGTVPRRNRYALGAFVGLAVLMLGVLLTTRPDVRPWIDRARPYIGDFWHTGEMNVGRGAPPT